MVEQDQIVVSKSMDIVEMQRRVPGMDRRFERGVVVDLAGAIHPERAVRAVAGANGIGACRRGGSVRNKGQRHKSVRGFPAQRTLPCRPSPVGRYWMGIHGRTGADLESLCAAGGAKETVPGGGFAVLGGP